MQSESSDILFDSDYLGFNNVKEIKKILKDEKILFSDRIIKINKHSWNQTRNLVITNKGIYNFKRKSLKRRIPIQEIQGITVSTSTDQFIIHGADNEYDYEYLSGKKKEIIRILNDEYLKLTSQNFILCQVNDKNLKQFVTTKKEKKSNPNESKLDSKYEIDINVYLGNNFNRDFQGTETLISNHKSIKRVKLEDFKVVKVVGRGTFGKVCLVEYLPSKEYYAMKSLKKDVLIEEEQIENTLLEKEILQNINYIFLCGLVFCFQTKERIFFVMPFLNGGELFQHLRKARMFDEQRAKFYGSQIALALDYLHKKGIVYRDLKPENILMDKEGYLTITDFGMAKKLKPGEKAFSFCGTPEYLAPEIIKGEGHDCNADWWSFGILLYEMICGLPPFYDENIDKMYELIQKEPLKFPKRVKMSNEAKDIIMKFLDRDPKNRLGGNGIDEIKKHPFFSSIDFDQVESKQLKAPFIPNLTNDIDVRYFDEEFTNERIGISAIPPKNMELIKENQSKFKDF